jgi:hypothetical protein
LPLAGSILVDFVFSAEEAMYLQHHPSVEWKLVIFSY